jgi:Ca2+-binding EF-hand superfamily protein
MYVHRRERGEISVDELKKMLELRIHFYRDRFFELLESDMETKNITLLSFDQFLRAITVFHPQSSREEKLKYMFRVYDVDGDGQINKDDLANFYRAIFINSAFTYLPPSKRPNTLQPSPMITEE